MCITWKQRLGSSAALEQRWGRGEATAVFAAFLWLSIRPRSTSTPDLPAAVAAAYHMPAQP